jgi:two-component sensor histidine kinase
VGVGTGGATYPGPMPTFSEMIGSYGTMSAQDVEWLHLLVGDWQVIADLAFADLVLWLPTGDGDFVAVAHVRPSTGATVYYEDVVDTRPPAGLRATLQKALDEKRPWRPRVPRWGGSYSVRDEAVPVVRQGKAIAVLGRQMNLGSARTPGRLELNYIDAANELCGMVSRGEFPSASSATGPRRGAPRVGDGLIRLDGEGFVLYASPNAISCFHRFGVIGELVGLNLSEVILSQLEDTSLVDESLPVVAKGRAQWRTELETRGVSISLRSLPLVNGSRRVGALVLCRDVSELRRRERELITKDATIREIHHRVKNNLQTVAALLRLQSRRVASPDARAALNEAMRRVATIALVHEMLSQTINEVVDFDEVFGRSLRLAADVASAGANVRTQRQGAFGLVRADDATALALVLTELVTNAVEHGLVASGGTVTISAERDGQDLVVRVIDDGVGMPDRLLESSAGLGTQIVRTLVRGELSGSIEWKEGPGGGTEVVLHARLREMRAVPV